MCRTILFLLILFLSLSACGQNNIKDWDKALTKQTKGKLKKIVERTRSKGFATFYHKSSKAVFAVEQRGFITDGSTDSTYSFSGNFKNDSLFRIVLHRTIFYTGKNRVSRGTVIMYLDGNTIIEQKTEGVIYIPEISNLIKRAYQMLDKAKTLISKKHN